VYLSNAFILKLLPPKLLPPKLLPPKLLTTEPRRTRRLQEAAISFDVLELLREVSVLFGSPW
jgi:hypothetical protein